MVLHSWQTKLEATVEMRRAANREIVASQSDFATDTAAYNHGIEQHKFAARLARQYRMK